MTKSAELPIQEAPKDPQIHEKHRKWVISGALAAAALALAVGVGGKAYLKHEAHEEAKKAHEDAAVAEVVDKALDRDGATILKLYQSEGRDKHIRMDKNTKTGMVTFSYLKLGKGEHSKVDIAMAMDADGNPNPAQTVYESVQIDHRNGTRGMVLVESKGAAYAEANGSLDLRSYDGGSFAGSHDILNTDTVGSHAGVDSEEHFSEAGPTRVGTAQVIATSTYSYLDQALRDILPPR